MASMEDPDLIEQTIGDAEPDHEPFEGHPNYDPVGHFVGDSTDDAVRAWIEMVYPREANGRIMIEGDQHVFVQNPDGSGFVDHGGDRGPCAVRSANGVVLVNQSHNRDICDISVHGSIERIAGRTDGIEWQPHPFQFFIDVLDFSLEDPDAEAFFRDLTEIDIYQIPDDEREITTDSAGILMVNPEMNERLFAGRDHTARGVWNQRFGFVPDENTPVPSAKDAIELLKPDEVAAAQAQGKVVTRQGEWFLVPMDDDPKGTIQRPGVGSRPYGASPLDSHIPTEWASLVSDRVFLDRFDQVAAYRPDLNGIDPETPQEAVEAIREHLIDNDDFEGYGWFDMLTTMAGAVCVRGTFRHRRNEHYMETVEGWHRAYTHDYDVLVADEQNDYVMVD